MEHDYLHAVSVTTLQSIKETVTVAKEIISIASYLSEYSQIEEPSVEEKQEIENFVAQKKIWYEERLTELQEKEEQLLIKAVVSTFSKIAAGIFLCMSDKKKSVTGPVKITCCKEDADCSKCL